MSLKGQVILGLKWTTFATACLAVVAILKISILARFLDKSDFGLMALITFVMGFMNLFSDMGLSTAILHKQTISKQQYASLYWFNIVLCLGLYGLLWVITPLVANLYQEPALNTLIPLLGLNLIISGAGIQFKTIETKHLNFKSISLIDMIAAVASLVLAIWLAVNNYGVLALVYSALLQYALANLLFIALGLKKYGLLMHFKFHETLPFLRIGIYQVGGQVVNYFNRDLDILLIGKFFSTEILGGYSLAKQLVFRPAQIINPILIKVASPTLAKFQMDKALLKTNYLKLIKIVSSINIPVYILIIVFAPVIVTIMYGAGFDNIVTLVRILSLYMIFRAIGNPIGSLVTATGRTDLEFYWNLLNVLIMPIFIYIGANYSIEAVAWSLVVAAVTLFVPSWRLLTHRMTGASLKEYITAIVTINFKF
ncbi:MOP flippase family protein [Bizionia sediminis]|uniref:MOP flippase family protein n=1 Tax=Bizionia sediminis TaxID=1737064 RepID=A0ABW5KTG9_9FLAO